MVLSLTDKTPTILSNEVVFLSLSINVNCFEALFRCASTYQYRVRKEEKANTDHRVRTHNEEKKIRPTIYEREKWQEK